MELYVILYEQKLYKLLKRKCEYCRNFRVIEMVVLIFDPPSLMYIKCDAIVKENVFETRFPLRGSTVTLYGTLS
jgi:hypothetical protein